LNTVAAPVKKLGVENKKSVRAFFIAFTVF
jgi:hypothetical protein